VYRINADIVPFSADNSVKVGVLYPYALALDNGTLDYCMKWSSAGVVYWGSCGTGGSATSIHWDNVTNTPTTLAGYGITDGGSAYTLPYDNISNRPTIGGVTVAGNILDSAEYYPILNQNTIGNAGTATALAANGTNCSSGQASRGVDASGNAEDCWTPLANVALGTDTTGDYVGGVTTGGFLKITGTEGATLGLWDNCTQNDIPKWNGTAWACAVDASGGGGGNPAFDNVLSGTNTVAAMVVGTGASIATSGSGTIAATTATTAGNLTGTPALPNGTTATTQTQADASTKLATTAYVDTGLGGKAATNQTMNIGTTSVAINRGSGALALTGITSIDGSAANLSFGSDARGDLAVRGASVYGRLAKGTTGKIVTADATDTIWSAYTLAAPGASGAVLYSDGTNWTRNTSPSISASNMSSFPTLNQNTTGVSGGLSSQYINWGASSGGTSIANKPTLGTASAQNVGTLTDTKSCIYTTGVGIVCNTTPAAGGGDFSGPASNASDNGVVLFSGTGGKTGKDSPCTVGADNAMSCSGGFTGSQSATASGIVKLWELTGNGSNYVAWKAPDSLAGNVTWVLPSADSAGAFMSDGAGTVTLNNAPSLSAANMTSFPTLNQNTTGSAAALSAQYINWSSSSGATSIANKPTVGTLAALAAGTMSNTKYCTYASSGTQIVCDSTPAGGITDIVQDLTPQLGGDLDLNGHGIDNVSQIEMEYLNGVTSGIQAQLNAKVTTTRVQTFSFGIDNVVVGDDEIFPWMDIPRAITITRVTCWASTDNVVGNLAECTAADLSSCTPIDSTDWTIGGATKQTVASTFASGFENAGIAAGAHIRWTTTSVGTTNANKLSCTVHYNE
jgi:hypothetical protein